VAATSAIWIQGGKLSNPSGRATRARCMNFFPTIYEIPRAAVARARCARSVPVKDTVVNLASCVRLSIDRGFPEFLRTPTKFSTRVALCTRVLEYCTYGKRKSVLHKIHSFHVLTGPLYGKFQVYSKTDLKNFHTVL
jgi:hypothetical protein